jgi:hypothetical protein
MSRYRTKDETDLVWNRTRRRITRDLDTKIQDFREELLNEMLTAAWDKYVDALETHTLVQLEDEASRWVDDVLQQQLRPKLEASLGDLANDK